jgi:hypothetical protein
LWPASRPHYLQEEEITQLSAGQRLTPIAFEPMNYWSARWFIQLARFHKNNELAGYCSVLHALELVAHDQRIRSQAAGGRHRNQAGPPEGAALAPKTPAAV